MAFMMYTFLRISHRMSAFWILSLSRCVCVCLLDSMLVRFSLPAGQEHVIPLQALESQMLVIVTVEQLHLFGKIRGFALLLCGKIAKRKQS